MENSGGHGGSGGRGETGRARGMSLNGHGDEPEARRRGRVVWARCAWPAIVASLAYSLRGRRRLRRRAGRRPGAEADHLASARRHRDALRDRRGQRGRRRVELRQVSAGGGVAAEGRRAGRSGLRAHPVAEARPGHRLRHADRSHGAARSRAMPMFRYRHAGLADITATMRELGDADRPRRGGGRVAGRDRAGDRRDSQARRRTAAAAHRAGLRPRAGHAAQHLRQRAASASCTTCSRRPAARTLRRRKRQSLQATTEMLLARAPRSSSKCMRAKAGRRNASRANARSGTGCRRCRPCATGRVYILADDRLAIPGPRVAEAVRLLADVLHPKAAVVRAQERKPAAAAGARSGTGCRNLPARQAMKVLLSWSSGKDSAWALHVLRQAGVQVARCSRHSTRRSIAWRCTLSGGARRGAGERGAGLRSPR